MQIPHFCRRSCFCQNHYHGPMDPQLMVIIVTEIKARSTVLIRCKLTVIESEHCTAYLCKLKTLLETSYSNVM